MTTLIARPITEVDMTVADALLATWVELDSMADEIMMAVASALAGKAAEAAVEGARGAWDALVRLVRGRFGRDRGAAAALEAAQAQPTDQAAVRELGQALERVASADSSFAEQVRALWPDASAELSARDGGVLNVSTGTVGGHLIQARDLRIEGGLSLGDVRSPGS
jgi:hypothetical protein